MKFILLISLVVLIADCLNIVDKTQFSHSEADGRVFANIDGPQDSDIYSVNDDLEIPPANITRTQGWSHAREEMGQSDIDIRGKCMAEEKCSKKGGVCKKQCTDSEKIKKGCKGNQGCKCCVPRCRALKKCTDFGGFCVEDATQCNGILSNDCKGKGCKCCLESCNLQQDPGSGKALKLRYYFNLEENQCLTFIWGGLDGNANRFKTYEECQLKCGGSPITITDVLCGNASTATTCEEVCNDNYEEWNVQPALPFDSAVSFCASNNNKQMACPLNDAAFIKWLREQNYNEDFWFNGKQETGNNNFNYMKWQSGMEISRNVHNLTNMWLPTFPKYKEDSSYCVKGQKSLSNDDCTTKLRFFCI